MTLLRNLLFWLWEQPDQNARNMTYTDWNAFLDSMAGLLAVSVIVTVAIAVIGYAVHARKLRITYADHYFASFTPLRWPLLLALTPAALVLWRFVVEYKTLFPLTAVSPLGAALQAGVWAGLLSFLLARLLVMLPGITPRKFRYRPLRPFVPSGAVSRTGGTP